MGKEKINNIFFRIMRKIIYILILFWVSQILTSVQNKDSIIYILPDKVEVKLSEHVEKENLSHFGFYLTSMDNEKYRIYISELNEGNKNYWQLNTNRYVILKNEKYPLYFDYDTFFSTRKPTEIGEYGKREGYILKSHPIFEGYNLTFDKTGKCLLEDWGIYRKESK